MPRSLKLNDRRDAPDKGGKDEHEIDHGNIDPNSIQRIPVH